MFQLLDAAGAHGNGEGAGGGREALGGVRASLALAGGIAAVAVAVLAPPMGGPESAATSPAFPQHLPACDHLTQLEVHRRQQIVEGPAAHQAWHRGGDFDRQ